RLGMASPYRMVLEEISRKESVPLVDSSALIAEARRKIQDELERKLHLQPQGTFDLADDGQTEVVFRVYTGMRPVPDAIYVVGAHPMLG
ncbi:MAG: hypothetical protein GTO24_10880, partial [candidate division Zixibacteria bacterium]|nr:hypothetical protein [candidate division Zixibacteria bacterium]